MRVSITGKSLTLLIMLAISMSILCACSSPAPQATPGPTPTNTQVTPTPPPITNGTNVVEVVYFHRTQRCYSCLYAGNTTEYAVETYFSQELADGKLVFETLNLEDPVNADIVEKYGAYTSSLFINEIKDGTYHIKAVTDIWFLIGDDEKFVNLVKSEIGSALGNN